MYLNFSAYNIILQLSHLVLSSKRPLILGRGEGQYFLFSLCGGSIWMGMCECIHAFIPASLFAARTLRIPILNSYFPWTLMYVNMLSSQSGPLSFSTFWRVRSHSLSLSALISCSCYRVGVMYQCYLSRMGVHCRTVNECESYRAESTHMTRVPNGAHVTQVNGENCEKNLFLFLCLLWLLDASQTLYVAHNK